MPTQQPPAQMPSAVPLKYARDTKRLYCRGVDFNNPVDSIRDGYYPILENLRTYMDGVLQPRLGITQVSAGWITNQTPIHSVKRLNNALNSTWTRVVGAGTKLSTGQSAGTNVQYNGSDVAFSGKPLAMIPWRPDQSPVSWIYVADSTAMYKLTYNGAAVTTHKVGIAPPTSAPTVELATPSIDGANNPSSGSIFTSTVGWTNQGIAAAVVHGNRFTGRTVTKILFDSGSTGWFSLVPSSLADIGPGTVLTTLTGLSTEYVMVHEVYRGGTLASNVVDKILYDNNPTNTGTCTIVPAIGLTELRRNCVVALGATPLYVRVTEVITGPDSTVIAFRCSTGATTISAADTLIVKDSFRGYSVVMDSTSTMQCDTLQTTLTTTASLTGSITYTPGAALDFTRILAGVGAFTDLDYMHLGFKTADLSKIIQGRIMFDCGDGSFLQNFFYRAFTPSDLTSASKATETTLSAQAIRAQNRISGRTPVKLIRNQGPLTVANPSVGFSDSSGQAFVGSSEDLEDFFDQVDPIIPDDGGDPSREQTGTGDSQWSELRWRRGDCTRVGSDRSKGWQAINAIRLEIVMITAGGAVLMEFSSFSLFGGAAPDVGDVGAPFLYRYRYRSSVTGATSNWSPATRSGVLSLRTKNKISFNVTSAPTSEVDLVDIQRWGGTVTAWADIATIGHSDSPFTDTADDDIARSTLTDSVDDINYQPWLITQSPKTGTATTVAGTLIKDSGTNFNMSWTKGTGMMIGGLSTTIRRVISTSLLEVEDCVRSGTNVTWQIPEPFISAQALPCLWGGGTSNGWFFACGDTTNPGRLYFSNQNNPDSTQDSYFLDITSPSEPLQNGFVYDARPYVFSSEKLYEIVEIAPGQFIARETPTGKGLMYRWAFCVGSKIWFLSKDGIYETDGGIARSITFDQLYPLFPKEGQLGTAVNGFNAPNMTFGNITVSGITADASTFFRLSQYDNYLYFIYPDTANRMRCLTYAIGNFSFVAEGSPQSGWYPDVFNPGNSNTGITCIYGEEGDGVHNLLLGGADTTTGKLYTYGGTDDNGTAINWHFRQASWDAGDRRADKIFADFMLNADPGGGTINVAAGINNYASTLALSAATMTGSGRSSKVFDIVSGNGAEAVNLAIDLSGTGTTARLYEIEPSYDLRPENTFLRAIQYDDAGYEGEKFFQAIEIEADTQNAVRTVRVEYDGGQLGDTLDVQHNGRLLKPYSFRSAFVGHLARLIPTDANQWKLFRWHWIYEPEPPLVTVWESQQTTFGHIGFLHLKSIWITHTSTADLTITITRMDDNTSRSFTVAHSAGVRGLESYILLGPPEFLKGKTYRFKITQASSTPFRIYQRNTGVMVKPWGSGQAFSRWIGWGGDAGDGVAQY